MVLSLVIASCGTKDNTSGTVTTTDSGQTVTTGGSDTGTSTSNTGGEKEPAIVTSEKPQYGGTINIALAEEPRWDIISFGGSWPVEQMHQRMFDGNWAKGPAGGYGEGLTTWGMSTRIPEFDTGYLASDYGWEITADGTEVRTWFTVREGVYFATPDSEAGRLVGGREMTVDDCVWNFNQPYTNEHSQCWQLYPNVRYPRAVKTGSDSFEIVHKLDDHIDALMRANLSARVLAPEVYETWGYESCTNWKYSVATGPFMVKDYVVGNMVKLDKNPNYWMTDPVGPGKGSQLPYVDSLNYYIIQDTSTRHAALRTGKLDQLAAITAEDKNLLLRNTPDLVAAERGKWRINPIFMKTDQAPYNDIRVRRAMLMATNFNDINESLYEGLGNIISWPYFQLEGYEPLYVSIDDPDCTNAIKELYTYNPDRAKELLAEAGYPNGFKAKLSLTQTEIDYYSIVADMWDQVGIELEMNVLPDSGTVMNLAFSIAYELIALGTSPNSSYPEQSLYAVRNWVNASLINEPYVDQTAKEVKQLAITDFSGSMELCRPLCIHLIEQAYCVPTPFYPTYTIWWPWVKNYAGENSVGYFATDHWTQWIWIDQNLKASMGY